MKKTEHLFYLIKSMSKSEKRYFKLFCSVHKTNPSFLAYYDSLAQEAEHPNTEKYYSISKQGTVPVKRYLNKQILKSLRSYNEKYSLEMLLQTQLSEIEILYNKKLGEQCCFLIDKTKELAGKHEKFAIQLQVFKWERKLKFLLDRTKRTEYEISKDEKLILNKYNNLNTYQHLFSEVMELKKKLGYIDEKHKPYLLEKIINNPALQDEQNCLSAIAKFYFDYTLTIAYWMLREHKKSFEYSNRTFNAILKSPIDEENFNGLLEHITACVCMGYYTEVVKKFKICELVLKQNNIGNNEITVARLKYYKEAYMPLCYMYLGDKKRLKKTVTEVENVVLNNSIKLNKEARLVVSNNLRTAYIYLEDLKSAWEMQKIILTNVENKLRADIYDEMLLFNVFYYLDKEESMYARASINTAYSHFKDKKDFKNSIEYLIFESLKNLEEFIEKKQIKIIYERIADNILLYTKKQSGLNDFLEDYFFYYFWAKSKIMNQPISQIMADWHLEHIKKLDKMI